MPNNHACQCKHVDHETLDGQALSHPYLSAQRAQQCVLTYTRDKDAYAQCGMAYPDTTHPFKRCPVCDDPIVVHVMYWDQR